MLHDIGHAIDHDRHNRHSYYLIKNAELFGFDTDEIEVIAQVARGHRKQAAKVDSPELKSLSPAKRRVVRGLAAILRVADALDRSHFGVVKNIEVRYSPGRVIVGVDSKREKADLELWTCERRTDLLIETAGSPGGPAALAPAATASLNGHVASVLDAGQVRCPHRAQDSARNAASL